MIIEDNNYFEVKNDTIESIERYFKRYPLDVANIARLDYEDVDPADDIEQLIISIIIFYHAIWKKAGALPAFDIGSVKRIANAILQFNPTFTHLNADEYNDFIKMVKEFSESKIEILGDNS